MANKVWNGPVVVAFVACLVLAQLALFAVPRADGHLLSSDGAYYYSYMRSILLDFDVDTTNDIALYNARVPEGSTTIKPLYVFSLGPGLLWSPFFLVGHAVAKLAAALGGSAKPDGYSLATEAAVCLGNVMFFALGVTLLAQLVGRLVSKARAAHVVIGVLLISPAIYYAIFEPTMSHCVELFTSTLFFWTLLARPVERTQDYLRLGAAAALMFLVRWQNAVLLFALLPLLLGLAPFEKRRLTVWAAVAFAAGAVPVAFLQLLFWKLTNGSFVTVPQGSSFMTWTSPHLVEVLFSTRHGLLSWHPGLVLGIVGLLFIRPRALALALGGAFVIDLFVCSVAGDWWGGDAFGMRRMIGALPILVLGCAAALDALTSVRARRLLIASTAMLALWNFAFMVQYRVGMIPRGEPLTFDQMITDKVFLPTAVVKQLRPQ